MSSMYPGSVLLFASCFLWAASLWAQPGEGGGKAAFIRNEGQWDDQIQFKTPIAGGNIFFERDRVTWQLYDMPSRHQAARPVREGESVVYRQPEPPIRGHVFRIRFLGATPSEIIPGGQRPEYHNYFLGNDPLKWAGGVRLFDELVYKNLYPGIDLKYYGYGDALKYDFIVQPGASPGLIRLGTEGLDGLRLSGDSLVMETSLGRITELPPIAYQPTSAGNIPVRCAFKLIGGEARFVFPDGYLPDLPLVIDPVMIFSTHTGSTSDNWGFTATYDEFGNAYAGGIQWGIGSGYPTTVGAFQLAYGGGQADVTLSKFNPTGTGLIFSTYLGGNGHDQPHSLVVNANNELIVLGRTNSPNFPVQAGSFDITFNGNYDIFVTKFNVAGTSLTGSTYLGGSGNDGVNGSDNFTVYTGTKYNYADDARGEVIVDDQGFIYVGSPTRSTNFPVTPGAHKGFLSGPQDGVLVKLTPNLSGLVWSTYFGGNGEEGIYGLKLDDQSRVYFTGGTTGTGLPVSPNAYRTTFGGITDGFVGKLSANGATVVNCTYLGTNRYDQAYLIELDRDYNVYVTGQTESNAFPVVSPPGQTVYQNPGAKQFITKFNNDLSSVIFSTVFGSNNSQFPNISPTAFLVDRCDNVYVTGWGGISNSNVPSTTNGMAVTPGALKTTTDGSDMYLIVLSRNAQTLVYGSYLGGTNGLLASSGEHVDGGTCRFDPNGVVYHAICSGCGNSAPFPPTPGVWSPNMASSNCNLALFKLDFELAGIVADFLPRDNMGRVIQQSQGCAPLTVRFDNRSIQGAAGTTTYFWDFQDNGATSNQFEPVHVFQNPGVYQVMLVITDPASCNISDTTFKTITVFPPPVVDAGPDQTVCDGDTITVQTSSTGVTFAWSGPATFITPPTQPATQALMPASGSLVLALTDANGCIARDTLQIAIALPVPANAGEDLEICRGGAATLTANSPTAVSFVWSSAPVLPLGAGPSINITNLDTTTAFFLFVEDSLGCPGEDTVIVRVFEVFTSADTIMCPGDSIQLRASNGVSFQWTPNFFISNPGIGSPLVYPPASATYNVEAHSADGCISQKSISVDVLSLPTAAAFSDTTICFGDQATLRGQGGNRYLWLPGGTISTQPNIQVSPAEPTQYTLVVFDGEGCRDTAFVQVNVQQLPVMAVTPAGGATICGGDSVQLSATGASFYEWTPSADLDNPAFAAPLARPAVTTLFQVTGTDDLGCAATATVQINVIPRPEATISGVNRTCLGGNIVLRAAGGQQYLWSTGATTDSISLQATETGWYWVIARIGECVSLPDSQFIDEAYGLPVAAFIPLPDSGFAPMRVQFENRSTGGIRYEWLFGQGFPRSFEFEPSIVYPNPGSYSVRLIVLAEGGCTDTAYWVVFADKVSLFAPSAFTPNGDDINDRFQVGYFGIRSLTVSIYSRWGMKVFESDDKDFAWDGTYKDADAPEGVYVWVIEGLGENGLSYRQNGTVTLIR